MANDNQCETVSTIDGLSRFLFKISRKNATQGLENINSIKATPFRAEVFSPGKPTVQAEFIDTRTSFHKFGASIADTYCFVLYSNILAHPLCDSVFS